MSDVEILNTKQNGIIEVDGVAFLPGANRVTSETAAKLRGLSYFQTLLARGLLVTAHAPEVEEAQAPAGAVFTLKGLASAEVKRLVSECSDLAQLRAWLNTDGRPGTRKAIEARAAQILAEQKAKEDASSNDK